MIRNHLLDPESSPSKQAGWVPPSYPTPGTIIIIIIIIIILIIVIIIIVTVTVIKEQNQLWSYH